jgi:hypothetical protein
VGGLEGEGLTCQPQPGVERLLENGMGRVEDELGKEDLVAPTINL